MRKYIGLLGICLSLGLVWACEKEKTEPTVTTELPDPEECDSTISFTSDVTPILTGSCAFAGCHGNGSAQSGVNLSNYSGVVAAVENKNMVASIKHEAGVRPMPQGGKLSDADIKTIECWVVNGMANN